MSVGGSVDVRRRNEVGWEKTNALSTSNDVLFKIDGGTNKLCNLLTGRGGRGGRGGEGGHLHSKVHDER